MLFSAENLGLHLILVIFRGNARNLWREVEIPQQNRKYNMKTNYVGETPKIWGKTPQDWFNARKKYIAGLGLSNISCYWWEKVRRHKCYLHYMIAICRLKESTLKRGQLPSNQRWLLTSLIESNGVIFCDWLYVTSPIGFERLLARMGCMTLEHLERWREVFNLVHG